MSKRIVMFGELLLRLNPEGFGRLVQADRLQVYYTGGEANAGAALVHWGREVSLVSRVPDHEIGQACINHMRRYGLDTRFIQRGGDRLGLFYLETGASQRQSKIIYDRRDSAFTGYSDEAGGWDEILTGAGWLHFAGTAVAVAGRLAPVVARACRAARERGLVVSCDLNYRRKLWTPAQAGETMGALLPLVDAFVCGVEDAGAIFGATCDPGRPGPEQAADVARQLAARFGLKHLVVPLRESQSATANRFRALLFSQGQMAVSRTHEIPYIVDRVGAGDALTAGVIFGLSEGWEPQRTIEFGVAAACLKHSVPGDFNLVSREEVEALVAGDGAGRIQR